MKKQLFLSLALAMFIGVAAQDTIHTRALKGNYFYNNWPFDTAKVIYPWHLTTFPGDYPFFAKNFYTTDTLNVVGIAVALDPMDTIHYTISVLDMSYDNVYEYFMLFEPSADTLQVFSDSLLIHQRHTPIAYYMDFDYNYNAAHPGPFYQTRMPVLEVYEAFFDHPYQVVPGRFYVGRSNRSYSTDTVDAATGIHYNHATPWMEIAEIYAKNASHLMSDTITVRAFFEEYWDTDDTTEIDPVTGAVGHHAYDTTITASTMSNGYWFLFPILALPDDTIVFHSDTIVSGDLIVRPGNTVVIAPGDIIVIGGDTIVNTGDTLTVTLGDTVVISGHPIVINPGDTLTVNPGDTLFVNSDGSITVNPGGTIVVSSGGGGTPGIGIQTNDLLYRYTSVQPNPATDKVRVTSSFGLTRIEAYDLRGRLLFETPASGLKADLDVSSWPRGTYLLRISTPAGPTTKKLLIH